MRNVTKQDVEYALELIEAVKRACTAKGVPMMSVDTALENAAKLLESEALSIDELAPKIVEAWTLHLTAIQKQVLGAAEEIATVRLAGHLADYRGEAWDKAEADTLVRDIEKRNGKAIRELTETY